MQQRWRAGGRALAHSYRSAQCTLPGLSVGKRAAGKAEAPRSERAGGGVCVRSAFLATAVTCRHAWRVKRAENGRRPKS